MIFALLAWGASVARLHRVRGATTLDLPPLTNALGRTPQRARLVKLRDLVRAETAGWELEVLDAALDSRGEAERAARIDEILSDVAATLRWGSHIPAAAARLSALGSLAVLFFGIARQSTGLGYILPPLAWGGVGVVGALVTRREADRIAGEARKSIDAWIERVLAGARSPGS